jgi:hypothetical protein
MEIDALVQRSYLRPKDQEDERLIEEAANAFISDALLAV